MQRHKKCRATRNEFALKAQRVEIKLARASLGSPEGWVMWSTRRKTGSLFWVCALQIRRCVWARTEAKRFLQSFKSAHWRTDGFFSVRTRTSEIACISDGR
jgi:hypothetical protein